MSKFISELLDKLSEYLAHRRGLLPLIGLGLIVLNLILNIIPFITPIPEILYAPNIFLHLGLIIALIGLMLAWAL